MNYLRNKYSLFLFTIFSIFVIIPIADILGLEYSLSLLLVTLVTILAIFTIYLSKKNRNILVGITFFNLFTSLLSVSYDFNIVLYYLFNTITLSIYAVLLTLLIVLHIKKLIKTTEVNFDMIKAGIIVYILIGILWSLFYLIIYLYDVNAFSGTNEFPSIVGYYYSFTVLTTLGFGDILPVNSLAKGLTSMEAICGVIYISIFVALLVGRLIKSSSRKRR